MISYKQKHEGENFVKVALADKDKPLEQIAIGGQVYNLPDKSTVGSPGDALVVDADGKSLKWASVNP